ncbi:hypothetical protein F4810DRAFT_248781 [Camillea tinctor]|nr:hypothetical protein F4810DRAFT_248781 [Camillea tinctor]
MAVLLQISSEKENDWQPSCLNGTQNAQSTPPNPNNRSQLVDSAADYSSGDACRTQPHYVHEDLKQRFHTQLDKAKTEEEGNSLTENKDAIPKPDNLPLTDLHKPNDLAQMIHGHGSSIETASTDVVMESDAEPQPDAIQEQHALRNNDRHKEAYTSSRPAAPPVSIRNRRQVPSVNTSLRSISLSLDPLSFGIIEHSDYVWYCCQCSSGPNSTSVNLECPQCGESRCGNCEVSHRH